MTAHCFYCGRPTLPKGSRRQDSRRQQRTRDHLTPVAQGGSSIPHNIVIACQACNNSKGALSLDEYRVVLAMRGKKFAPDFLAKLLAEATRVQPFFGDSEMEQRRQQAAWEAADGEPDWKGRNA